MSTFESHDDSKSRILAAWSVSDLVEQHDSDLERGDEMFHRSQGNLEILGQGRKNLIDWWVIRSGANTYQCRRFKNFAYCSCKDFHYRHKVCRHLALTTGVKCERCGVSRARVGKYCWDCDGIVNRFNREKL